MRVSNCATTPASLFGDGEPERSVRNLFDCAVESSAGERGADRAPRCSLNSRRSGGDLLGDRDRWPLEGFLLSQPLIPSNDHEVGLTVALHNRLKTHAVDVRVGSDTFGGWHVSKELLVPIELTRRPRC